MSALYTIVPQNQVTIPSGFPRTTLVSKPCILGHPSVLGKMTRSLTLVRMHPAANEQSTINLEQANKFNEECCSGEQQQQKVAIQH